MNELLNHRWISLAQREWRMLPVSPKFTARFPYSPSGLQVAPRRVIVPNFISLCETLTPLHNVSRCRFLFECRECIWKDVSSAGGLVRTTLTLHLLALLR